MNELLLLALIAAMAAGFVLSELRSRQTNPDYCHRHNGKDELSDSRSAAKWM